MRTGSLSSLSADTRSLVEMLLDAAGRPATVVGVEDAGGGRGVFSETLRLRFDDGATAVAKLPGPNRLAALSSGAFERERLAYAELLPRSPVRAPACEAIVDLDDGSVAFLLEDLGGLRRADQADGLAPSDAAVVAASLAPFHRFWRDHLSDPAVARVRRHAPATFGTDALTRGLDKARTDWGAEIDLEPLARRLADRAAWLERFVAAPATLCHGDVRADNLVFEEGPDGDRAVLFDWQQLAIQTPGADLAWLLATSCRSEDLDEALGAVTSASAIATGRSADEIFEMLVVGAVLPASAVLLLAQRDTPDDATRALVGRSLSRIAAFVARLDRP